MIDHVGLPVSDLQRSRKFYEDALQPLGRDVMMEWPGGVLYTLGGGGMLALRESEQVVPIHVAFGADRDGVHAFHEAALAAGGEDNGEPGIRSDYHANYYAAFVRDPDGHNIEAVCHKPE
jgi:catechol 2,3-dioxygenase-like lactoylglutathione lyase family enzyme